MNDIIIYMLKVVAIQGIFFGLYWCFLRKSGRHSLNRWYLITALVFSFVIPLVSFSMPYQAPEIVQENPVIVWLSDPAPEEFEFIPVKVESQFSPWSLLPWIYGCIVLAFLLRSTFYLSVLHRLKKHSEPIPKRWFTLFKTSQNRPFSFFSNVFVPRWLFGTAAFDQVLAHECVHVRQRHSLDRLLLDFVASLFWFNPFIYWYRNAVIEIHEYQADEAVIREFNDPIAYQEILYSQLQSPQYSGLVSHFNFQMIKKRIVMMNKQKKRTGWIYVLALPITLMTVFAFSSKEAMEPIDRVGEELSAMVGPLDEVASYAEQFFQSDSEPSILPLKEEDVPKMTSGFGMRMHPLLKVKKMHYGMDMSCQIGSPVIATGDGTVLELKTDRIGYGKFLTIDHGNDIVTRYAQLSDFKVKKGNKVKKGQVVALSGNSGASTGPHLHYEVIKSGTRVDPKNYVKNYSFKAPSYTSKKAHEEFLTTPEEKAEKEKQELREKDELTDKEEKEAKEALIEAEEERLEGEKENKPKEDHTISAIKVKDSKASDDPPLYILDGEAISGSEIAELSQSDVEAVTVLKGQEARREYGESARNGVVIIESKAPNRGKIKRKVKAKSKRAKKINKRVRNRMRSASRRVKYAGVSNAELLDRQSEVTKVIIDPGHGGKDGGAVSSSGYKEKDISLSVAHEIQALFQNDPQIEVVLTRNQDTYLDLRRRSVMSDDADLFISLHVEDANGLGLVTPVYSNQNEFEEGSHQLARLLSSEFQQVGKETKIGYSSGYWVLNKANCPAVLLKIGGFSDPKEVQYLSSLEGRKEVAGVVSEAIQQAVL